MEGPVESSAQGELKLAPARLYGEPFAAMPTDLYIPPDALEVFLDAFEGPLDLLLYLIRKANVDILDIPMAQLTAQYLEYVEAMRAVNLELAAEYLLMAAMLLEIKSRMLLPRPPRESEGEVEDPRAELVRRLMDYEQIKRAAAELEVLPRALRDFEWVGVQIAEKIVALPPTVDLNELQQAWMQLMKRARVMRHHKVKKDELSVREYMSAILRRLAGAVTLRFEQLFEDDATPPQLVVNFLAVLELARESLIEVIQIEAFAPIHIRASHVESSATE